MLFSATSKNCGDISEEATSESDGSFRFRGLKPKCNYVITFLSGESIEKIIPSQVEGKKSRVIVILWPRFDYLIIGEYAKNINFINPGKKGC